MHLERLHQRQLFSVTVTEGYPGFYQVDGSNNADAINISVSMADDTFSVNGTTYTDVSYIFVNGYGGDDQISVISVDGIGMIGASINAGDGHDDISLNFDGGVWAGSGNDTLYLADSFRGEAYGESGNDNMYISGDCIDAQIEGDEGNDLIDCSNNHSGVVVMAGEGNDTVYGSAYDDQIYGDDGCDELYGNDGNDMFYTRDGGRDQVFGGEGHDVVMADSSAGPTNSVEEIYYA